MISERVARGVALLDSVEPGWFHRVDVDALNVASSKYCVLGQLFRDYSLGAKALGLDQDGAAEHGFQVTMFKGPWGFEETVRNSLNEYPALAQEWRRVIEILRQKTATEVTVEEKELVLV